MLEALSATEREYLLRLGAALLCGMVLGAGREIRGKRAGLRTHALMAFSAALLTVTGLHLMTTYGGPNSAEAIGISCGSGMYLIAGIATLVTLLVIEALPMVERAVPQPSAEADRPSSKEGS